jgi:hypothetical protein
VLSIGRAVVLWPVQKISEISGIQEILFLGFMLRLIDMPFFFADPQVRGV